MIKKTITYTDYTDTEHTEDFYFNLSKAEILEMETSEKGGLSLQLEYILTTKDTVKIMETFKDIILKSYGVKSPDGKQFIKTKETLEAFIYSEAYVELYIELATNDTAAADFVNGIMPKGMIGAKKDIQKKEA